jgi:hypothetical protein
MIENHRSRLLWDLFMANPEVPPMLGAIGFHSSPNIVHGSPSSPVFSVYPNPAKGEIRVVFSTTHPARITFDLYSIGGQHVRNVTREKGSTPGNQEWRIDTQGLDPGLYLARLTLDGTVFHTARIMIQ